MEDKKFELRPAQLVGVLRVGAMLAVLTLVLGACQDQDAETVAETAAEMPIWLEAVYPEPGATVAVPDAVEVDHTLQRLGEDVRLVVDGVDVTTYAAFDAGKIRYESGTGPVVLGTGSHTAEVQLVRLPAFGAEYEVLDSFTWEFFTA